MFKTIANPDGTISIVPVTQNNNLPFNVGERLFNEFNNAGAVPNVATEPYISPTYLMKQQLGMVPTGITASSAAIPFGSSVDIEQGFTQNTPSDQGTNFQFLSSAFEDETDEVEDKKSGGIADLFRAILGFVVPGASFFLNQGRDTLGGIKSLNQRLRNTDFAKSTSLVDYLARRKRRKETEFLGSGDPQGNIVTYDPARTRNRQRIMNIQPTNQDRGRGQITSRTTSAPRRSSSTYSAANRAFARDR